MTGVIHSDFFLLHTYVAAVLLLLFLLSQLAGTRPAPSMGYTARPELLGSTPSRGVGDGW